MKIKQHDDVVKYLEDVVKREYGKLIRNDKAIVRTKWEYEIPLEYENHLFGECDFVYMDFEARSTYIVEVKHDYSKRNKEKATHQLIKDMWATSEFYSWAFQNGYMAWYYPQYSGKKLITDANFRIASKYLKDYSRQRIKEYEEFFKKILKLR